MKHLMILPLLVLVAGCASDRRSDTEVRMTDTPAAGRDNAADDNLQIGATSRLSDNQTDQALTLSIRESVASDEGLAGAVENVTIITKGGVVTLMGTINSEAEKNSLASKIQGVRGVNRVDNQLQVAKNKNSDTVDTNR